ncbi:MAG: DUF1015 domain-containing protein [Flavobacteriales bacterium]
MPKVRPFKAVRPTRDKAHLVASRSYVTYSPSQLRSKLTENPYSFLHVIHPDMTATQLHRITNLHERFEQVKSRYDSFLAEGVLVRDETPSLYIYRQSRDHRSYTGIIAAVSVEDYLTGKVKRHEHTLSSRESTFVDYLNITRMNAEPVLLISEYSHVIENTIDRYLKHRPEYDFTTTNRDHHQLWMIEDHDDIEAILHAYGEMDAFYIADGHHRLGSSAQLYERNAGESLSDQHALRYCLSYIINERDVRIYEYNRVVRDLNGHTPAEFLRRLEMVFHVQHISAAQVPAHPGELTCYLGGDWYHLIWKEESNVIDAQRLTDDVLTPILGVYDLRKDKRVQFVEGPAGLEEINQRIDRLMDGVGFSLFPVGMEAIKHVADTGGSMPPKSTWIEPKLRSGLIVYELNA